MAEDRHVADATTFRLDTADIASDAGWQLESLSRIDEFSKDGVIVMVHYAADDEIDNITRSRDGRADDVYGADSPGKSERLRLWLGVRAVSNRNPMPAGNNNQGAPVTVQRLRAEGMSFAAYVKNGDDLQLLQSGDKKVYAIARDYIRAFDGRAKVMWKRDGSASESGDHQEMWWAEMSLPDGQLVGWFYVNDKFRSP